MSIFALLLLAALLYAISTRLLSFALLKILGFTAKVGFLSLTSVDLRLKGISLAASRVSLVLRWPSAQTSLVSVSVQGLCLKVEPVALGACESSPTTTHNPIKSQSNSPSKDLPPDPMLRRNFVDTQSSLGRNFAQNPRRNPRRTRVRNAARSVADALLFGVSRFVARFILPFVDLQFSRISIFFVGTRQSTRLEISHVNVHFAIAKNPASANFCLSTNAEIGSFFLDLDLTNDEKASESTTSLDSVSSPTSSPNHNKFPTAASSRNRQSFTLSKMKIPPSSNLPKKSKPSAILRIDLPSQIEFKVGFNQLKRRFVDPSFKIKICDVTIWKDAIDYIKTARNSPSVNVLPRSNASRAAFELDDIGKAFVEGFLTDCLERWDFAVATLIETRPTLTLITVNLIAHVSSSISFHVASCVSTIITSQALALNLIKWEAVVEEAALSIDKHPAFFLKKVTSLLQVPLVVAEKFVKSSWAVDVAGLAADLDWDQLRVLLHEYELQSMASKTTFEPQLSSSSTSLSSITPSMWPTLVHGFLSNFSVSLLITLKPPVLEFRVPGETVPLRLGWDSIVLAGDTSVETDSFAKLNITFINLQGQLDGVSFFQVPSISLITFIDVAKMGEICLRIALMVADTHVNVWPLLHNLQYLLPLVGYTKESTKEDLDGMSEFLTPKIYEGPFIVEVNASPSASKIKITSLDVSWSILDIRFETPARFGVFGFLKEIRVLKADELIEASVARLGCGVIEKGHDSDFLEIRCFKLNNQLNEIQINLSRVMMMHTVRKHAVGLRALEQIIHGYKSSTEFGDFIRSDSEVELPQRLKVIVKLESVNVDVELTESCRLNFLLAHSLLTTTCTGFSGSVSSLIVRAEACNGMRADFLTMKMAKFSTQGMEDADVSMESAVFDVPFGFIVADIVENSIDTMKVIKELHGLPTKVVSHPLFVDKICIPNIKLASDVFKLVIHDAPFELDLGVGYTLGLEEQKQRLARERAFVRRLEKHKVKNAVDVTFLPHGDVENDDEAPRNLIGDGEIAWQMLLKFNSDEWIKTIASHRSKNTINAPLMVMSFEKIRLGISAASLPTGQSVQDKIHELDCRVDSDYRYSELIPLDIFLAFNSSTNYVRDYPIPLWRFSVGEDPESEYRGFLCNMLFIISEQAATFESTRRVFVPIFDDEEPVAVVKTINPIKVFVDCNTSLHTPQDVVSVWGLAYDPALTDISRVFDTFTRPNVDPSAGLPWWDKMRLLAHGKWKFQLSGGGDLKFKFTGSMSPYFRSLKHFGTDGSELIFGKGVDLYFESSGRQTEDVLFRSGELLLVLPNAKRLRQTDVLDQRMKEEVVLNLCSAVKVGFRFDFNCSKNRLTHPNVVLRIPELVNRLSGKRVDSFRGFRSKGFNVRLDILSPDYRMGSLMNIHNWAQLTEVSFFRLWTMSQLYMNPMTSLRIHKGDVFGAESAPPKLMKLSDFVDKINLSYSLSPMMFGYFHEFEGEDKSMGIRFGVQDFHLETEVVQQKSEVELVSSPEGKRTGCLRSKWLLDSARLEINNIEARTIHFGSDATEDNFKDPNFDPSNSSFDEDTINWLLREERLQNPSSVRTEAFMWAPKVVYHRRNVSAAEGVIKKDASDIRACQISLTQTRLSKVDSAIKQHIEKQRLVEHEMKTSVEKGLSIKSQFIVDKLAILFEKKAVLEQHKAALTREQKEYVIGDESLTRIRVATLGRHGRSTSVSLPIRDGAFAKRRRMSSRLGTTQLKVRTGTAPSSVVFNHHFIIHDGRVLWTRSIRNVTFKCIDTQSKNVELRHFLKYAALNVFKELSKLSKMDVGGGLGFATEGGKFGSGNDIEPQLGSDVVEDLLEQLVDEAEEGLVVQNEETFDKDSHFSLTHDRKNRSSLSSLPLFAAYTPSTDESSMDYVPSHLTVETRFYIQFINPQINLESHKSNDMAKPVCAILTAESAQLQAVNLLDFGGEETSSIDLGEVEFNERLAKTRIRFTVEHSQFFVVERSDVKGDTKVAIEEVMNEEGGSLWPIWVPPEFLIDRNFSTGYLQRAVDDISLSVGHEIFNRLYVNQANAMKGEDDQVDSVRVSFPQFVLSVDSKQFYVILDVIRNLLIYKDTTSVVRAERLSSTILALEQTDSMNQVMETVVALQEKVRHLQVTLRTSRSRTEDEVSRMSFEQMQKKLRVYREDLHLVMSAVRDLNRTYQSKHSAKASWKVNVEIGLLRWFLLQDSSEPVLASTLQNISFGMIHFEDQSSVNTLEIDKIYTENLLSTDKQFKDFVAPYLPKDQPPDAQVQKMLRVFWRELSPVAGIPILDHFEINMFPLVFQMTHELGKQIISYIFPEKKDSTGTTEADENVMDSRKAEGKEARTRTSTSNSQSKQMTRSVSNFFGNNEVADDEKTSDKDKAKMKDMFKSRDQMDDLRVMKCRAAYNRTYIYIKVPSFQICLSYKGSKEKNFEDLREFVFRLPTLEYRNKTWTSFEFVEAIKKDVIRAILAHTGLLMREKILGKSRKTIEEKEKEVDKERDKEKGPHDRRRGESGWKFWKDKKDFESDVDVSQSTLGGRTASSFSVGSGTATNSDDQKKAKMLFGKSYV